VDRDNEVNRCAAVRLSGAGVMRRRRPTRAAACRRILWAFKLNPFEKLNLRFDCNLDDVKKAYRKISLMVHPDKCKHPHASTAFESGWPGAPARHGAGAAGPRPPRCRLAPGGGVRRRAAHQAQRRGPPPRPVSLPGSPPSSCLLLRALLPASPCLTRSPGQCTEGDPGRGEAGAADVRAERGERCAAGARAGGMRGRKGGGPGASGAGASPDAGRWQRPAIEPGSGQPPACQPCRPAAYPPLGSSLVLPRAPLPTGRAAVPARVPQTRCARRGARRPSTTALCGSQARSTR
jgi:hypothetical protein